jgi:hypothetical protein
MIDTDRPASWIDCIRVFLLLFLFVAFTSWLTIDSIDPTYSHQLP